MADTRREFSCGRLTDGLSLFTQYGVPFLTLSHDAYVGFVYRREGPESHD